MKKKLTNNISLKIISLILGFMIWLVVVNVDNPTVTSSFTISLSGIELLNEAYIDNAGMMCMPDDSQEQIRVHVTGDRKTVRRLTLGSFHVSADMQQAVSLETDPVMVPITVTCSGISPNNIEVTPRNLVVHLKEKKTQEFVVTVSNGESKPGKGYEIGSLTANPEKIKITGPSSLINKIGSVTASVNVDGITEDMTKETELRFYDKNGDMLSESQMNYLNVVRTTLVSAELWKVRSNVRIHADYCGEPKEGYRVESVTTLPDVLNLAGSESGIQSLEEMGNQIEIPAERMNINGADADIEEKINITDYLPEDLKLTTGSSEDVWVKVSILPVGSRSYDLPTKNITVKNLDEKLQVVFDTEKIVIRIQENEENAEVLDLDQITAYIDLGEIKEGKHDVPVQIGLPDGYSLVENVLAEIRISAVSNLETDTE